VKKWFLLTCMALLALPRPAGAIAFVRSASASSSTSSTTVAASFPTNAAGDLLVVVAEWNDNGATATIADTALNSYSVALGPVDNPDSQFRQQIWFVANSAASAGTNTVTVTFSVAQAAKSILIHEYSGLNTSSPLDRSASASGTGTALGSGLTAATAQADELIFGIGTNDTATVTHTAGTGFTLRETQGPSAGQRVSSEDKIVAATGQYNATFTASATGTWTALVVTFKGAGGAAPAPKRLPVLGVGR